MTDAELAKKKEMLIKEIIYYGFLKTPAVIEAFRKVPRENFVPENMRSCAYINEPLPIGMGQTISQPLTVAAMTEALKPEKGSKILEVGSGSGYQAAILSEIVGQSGRVITTERIAELYEFAKSNLKNYKNVIVLYHDGMNGCKEHAPYDRIIVTAAAREIPEALLEQLAKGGRMVIPVGEQMTVVKKDAKGRIEQEFIGYYAFVPLLPGKSE